MKSTLTTIFMAICFFAGAQEYTKFYNWRWEETTLSYARFYAVITREDSLWHRRDYFIREKRLQMDGFYRDTSCKVEHGKFSFYHANGKLESTGNFVEGERSGTWISFHPNGMMRDSAEWKNGETIGGFFGWHSNGYSADSGYVAEDGSGFHIGWFDNGSPNMAGRYAAGKKKHGTWQYFHRNGQLSCKEVFNKGVRLSLTCFTDQGEPDDTIGIQREATFPGGSEGWKKFMLKHLYFPENYEIVNSDQAVVVLDAVIDVDGSVSEVTVHSPFHPAFDDIAVKMIKRSPKWTPAKSHNRLVKYRVRQAVTFVQRESD